MSFTLHVRLRKAEGALVRLLGQIGRRGYDVLGVRAELAQDRRAFDVVVEFEPFMPVPPAVQQARPAEVLPALVAKLVEVESVELRSSGPRPAPEAPAKGAAAAPKHRAAAGQPSGELHWEE